MFFTQLFYHKKVAGDTAFRSPRRFFCVTVLLQPLNGGRCRTRSAGLLAIVDLASKDSNNSRLRSINDALTVLKRKPGNGQDLYNLVYLSFIAPEQLSNQEVLYRLNMSPRHYYRLRKEAITILSLRLWSSPDPVIDLWLELIEMGQ